ncbi:MAG: hypothetical protein E6Q98_02860 [Rhodospirillaceae bacterium]|nr:MAG: hypothetical protein E6Q98_02860 [Rhodospirillaceae bacterium]
MRILGFSARRRDLLLGLENMCRHLAAAGATKVWLDGSFATAKPAPGDYDLCYPMTEVDENMLDPCFLDYSNERKAMKDKFLGEAWLDIWPSPYAGETMLDFFQLIKGTRNPKGIVEIDLRTLP